MLLPPAEWVWVDGLLRFRCKHCQLRSYGTGCQFFRIWYRWHISFAVFIQIAKQAGNVWTPIVWSCSRLRYCCALSTPVHSDCPVPIIQPRCLLEPDEVDRCIMISACENGCRMKLLKWRIIMSVCCTVSEIFSVKEWRDLETWGRGRSRSLKMAQFHRSYTTFY